jgi:predicted HicB family RNase H-like nuclease
MAEKKQPEGVNVKLDRSVFEAAKVGADKLGLSVAQYVAALIRMADK